MNDQLVNGTEQRPPSKVSAAQLVNGASKGPQQEQNTVALELYARENAFMPAMSMEVALARRALIVEFTARIMVRDKDFGEIPGTNKPTLLKPGAEKLCNFFGLEPEFTPIVEEIDWTGAAHNGEMFHYVRYRCRLLKDGRVLGVGEGSCNSWESKYRWRTAQRTCPDCGQATIIAGKPEWGGGWVCWQRKGGCGMKFEAGDAALEDQHVGRIPNPDVADLVNTIQKMAQKRALVAATLIATSASEFFTQDVEEDTADPDPRGYNIDTGGAPHGTKDAQRKVAERRIRETAPAKPAASEAKEPFDLNVAIARIIEYGQILSPDVYAEVLRECDVEDVRQLRSRNLCKKVWMAMESARRRAA